MSDTYKVKNLTIGWQGDRANNTLYANWTHDAKKIKAQGTDTKKNSTKGTKDRRSGYKYRWDYCVPTSTGKDKWYIANEGTTTISTADLPTYSPPDNATKVRIRVKILSKKYKDSKGKEASYFNSDYVSKTFTVRGRRPSVVGLSPPSCNISFDKKNFGCDISVDISGETITDVKFYVYDVVATDAAGGKYQYSLATADVSQTTKRASHKFNLVPGHAYRVRAAVRDKDGNWSYIHKEPKNMDQFEGWTDWSHIYPDSLLALPATPTFKSISIQSTETDKFILLLNWTNVRSKITQYTVEYADKKYKLGTDSSSTASYGPTLSARTLEVPRGEVNDLYFRVKATNETGDSEWSNILEVHDLGKPPAAPTTWSSVSTCKLGETVNLYWLHNSLDNSYEKTAQLEITVKRTGEQDIVQTFNINNTKDVDHLSDPSVYELNTGLYLGTNEATVLWRVRTKGSYSSYGDWSIQRTLTVYSPPSLTAHLSQDSNWIWDTFNFNTDNVLTANGISEEIADVITKYPFYIIGDAYPLTQKVIKFYVDIISNDMYTIYDSDGELKTVNDGDIIYSTIIDSTTSPLYETKYYTHMLDGDDKPILYELTKEEYDETVELWHTLEETLPPEELQEMLDKLGVDSVDKVYFSIVVNVDTESRNTNHLFKAVMPGDLVFNDGSDYTLKVNVVMDSGLTAESKTEFTVDFGEDDFMVDSSIGVDNEDVDISMDEGIIARLRPYAYVFKYYEIADMTVDPFVYTEITKEQYDLYLSQFKEEDGKYYHLEDGTWVEIPLSQYEVYTEVYVTVEESEIDNVMLSVYRRESDGKLKLIQNGITGNDTTVVDMHPALDYARYRIVGYSTTSGQMVYNDLPAIEVGEKAIIIQWDESWSGYITDANDDDSVLIENGWRGSLLRLPYNIDMSFSNTTDTELVEYIGREHPVSYYGTQLGETATWKFEFPKYDDETLYQLRRLSVYQGDCYVREPRGSGYWAHIAVSYDVNHLNLIIPVTLTVTRVEGGA